jgi:hypothetical protein
MAKRGGGLRFAREAPEVDRVSRQLFGQELQRDAAAQLEVCGGAA